MYHGQIIKHLENSNISAEAKETFTKIADGLLMPIYSQRNLGLTYSTIRHWEKSGYLLSTSEKVIDKWRKYTLVECLWIEVLKKLAFLGCSMEVVAPRLMAAYQNKKEHNSITVYKPLTEENLIPHKGLKVVPFTAFLLHVLDIFTKKANAIISLREEAAQFIFYNKMKKTIVLDTFQEFGAKSSITISISQIVFEHIALHADKSPIDISVLFSAGETQLIKLLQRKELKEVSVRLENGTLHLIDFTEKFTIYKDDDYAGKRLLEFFSYPYQSIRAITNGGKTIAFERTTTQKVSDV